ncbi:hypothetical protein LOD99_2623 [Oopsacas minuta]|uniref:CS domain-containing protein n=1 Tax=Oopsacas minuta TaxID=111878 RepID=A0AAV7K229_9METZ|nr:hypothetical protein LOD99_2623 [Oopsacas minuta]
MAISSETIPPFTRWAQREDKLYITLEVNNTNGLKSRHNIQEDRLEYFCVKEIKGQEPVSYELKIDFYGKIDPQKTVMKENDKEISFVLFKLTKKFWPRLVSSEKKLHYLKTDFDRWIDRDDDSDTEAEKEENLNNLMDAMGQVSEMGYGNEETDK